MKILWRFPLRGGILFLCLMLSITSQSGYGLARGEPPRPVDDLNATVTTITLEEPAITPSNSEICTSGWYRLENSFGYHPAFLSLNQQPPSAYDHSGEWRPNIIQPGIYRVEAYVPAHPSVFWPCNINQTIGWDTSSARYQINHANGQTTVSVNQAPLNDQWISLGEYRFNSGTGGYVVLDNQTSETGSTKTVSFSAIRFTWLSATQNTVFIPFLRNSEAFVDVDEVWTADGTGIARQVFTPGQSLQFHGSGTIRSSAGVQASITISQQGPCDSKTLFNGTVNFQGESWTYSHAAASPGCTGYFSYTMRLTYLNQTSEQTTNFIVSTLEQAFDKCNIPTLSQMQAWWSNSPYGSINLYIGGISRATACSNPSLDASWVSTASQQGWTFIPTWVGPQAPCSSYSHRMSSNATTAYQQGKDEAQSAATAAEQLGLSGEKVIYYDVEAYSGATTTCRNTVKSFIKGWVERLHELGVQAGVYGSPYNSYVSDWATINPIPDVVWVASWIRQNFDPSVIVWNINGLDNSLWSNHQRLRQYSGDHTETWGEVVFTIDSNAVDGAVSTLPSTMSENPVSLPLPSSVEDMQLFAYSQGWVIAGGRLYWSMDGGLSWQDITPAVENELIQPLHADFLDGNTGWLLARSGLNGRFTLFSTENRGIDWKATPLEGFLGDPQAELLAASMDFIDRNNGWLLFQIPSSSNFSMGRLFRTVDGGATWSEIDAPTAGKLKFITPDRGWLAGGPGGGELYQSEDGGFTWQPVKIATEIAHKHPGASWTGLPQFVDPMNGWLPIVIASDQLRVGDQPRVELYASRDQGQTWSLADTLSVDDTGSVTGPVPFATAASQWVLALPFSGELILGSATGGRERQSPDISGSLIALDFGSSDVGWGIVQTGTCSGNKLRAGESLQNGEQPFSCELVSKLLKTENGGATWTEITPGR